MRMVGIVGPDADQAAVRTPGDGLHVDADLGGLRHGKSNGRLLFVRGNYN